jgi:hypothetical protein
MDVTEAVVAQRVAGPGYRSSVLSHRHYPVPDVAHAATSAFAR